jgi:hypothetical protein
MLTQQYWTPDLSLRTITEKDFTTIKKNFEDSDKFRNAKENK